MQTDEGNKQTNKQTARREEKQTDERKLKQINYKQEIRRQNY
jgi:hypothetical protein